MNGQHPRTRVLITVLTYPVLSMKYGELVCTAGITEAGEWVRLYPIDLRYLPEHQRFRKYQWIEVELEPTGRSRDKRMESRRPVLDSIEILGEPLPPWKARTAIIDRLAVHTRDELRTLYKKERRSLGIVRPEEVLGVRVKPQPEEWTPGQQSMLDQFYLFRGQPKQLRKIPYKFSYEFRCADTRGTPHRAMIEDWELGALFLKESERLGDEGAASSVRKKYFEELCAPGRDTRFFMGTTYPLQLLGCPRSLLAAQGPAAGSRVALGAPAARPRRAKLQVTPVPATAPICNPMDAGPGQPWPLRARLRWTDGLPPPFA